MNKNIKYSQNFLTSEKVLNQIIKQLNLKETDTVYEIGTGKGHLTTKLAKISKQVTSIELDSHLFNLSSEKLKLTIEEASKYFRIGEKKLRKLAEENIDAGWVIVNGNRIQIKRKQFEKIIDTLDEI